jgi:hypothetical protein
MNATLGRGIATVLAIVLYGWINVLMSPVSTTLTGEAYWPQPVTAPTRR